VFETSRLHGATCPASSAFGPPVYDLAISRLAAVFLK
jgi:hypothetical protein